MEHTPHWATPPRLKSTGFLAAVLVLAPLTWAAEPSLDYIVQPNDELIRMAEQSFQSPDDWISVAKLNRLKNPNTIRPGQVLTIPLRMLKARALDGVLLSVSGDVRLAGQPALAGSMVPEGARLQTGSSSSAQLRLADGSHITLMPHTDTTLVSHQGLGLRGLDDQVRANWFKGLVRLNQGALDVHAAKLLHRSSPLQFETPTSLVGVRGTDFRVAFDGLSSQNARSEVLTGQVWVDSSAHKIGAKLTEGTGTVLNPMLLRIKVSPLLPAPTLTGSVVVYKPQALWQMPTLPGAERLKVQVSGYKDFSTIVREYTVIQPAQVNFSDLPNGVWHVRVRGIDADTLEGLDANSTLQVMLPASTGQAPLEWAMRNDRIELRDGRHVLHFEPDGLGPSHSILASARINRPPYVSGDKVLAKTNGNSVSLDLGSLVAGQSYQLNVSVVQADGALLTPSHYRFVALGEEGEVETALWPLTSDEVARPAADARPVKRLVAEPVAVPKAAVKVVPVKKVPVKKVPGKKPMVKKTVVKKRLR